MELTTWLIASVIFLIVFFWFRRPDPRLPPSPMRPLPIVGHLFHMSADTRPQFKEWRKRCGDIFSLHMGGTLVVVLNGYDLIKEALVKKADVFSHRPPYFMDEVTGCTERGLIFSSGQNWKEQTSVTVSIMKAFGMGKNLLAQKIEKEVCCYVKYLTNLEGKSTDIRIMTNISTSNIICSILIGRRFEYDDKDFQDLMHKLESVATDQQGVSLINFIYWLRYLPGDLFLVKKLSSSVLAILNVFKKFIDENRRHANESNEVYNFIDAYIIERNKKIQVGISTSLDDHNLIKIMFDLFIAGTETSSTTIYWCILYILNHPNVQEKVHQEIKDKVGTDRTPTLNDKIQLTYLNAVIMETQRLASILPLSVAHMCSEEVTLRGYTLPKGTYIVPNLDSVLHDKTTWGKDVMSFRPERFIDDNGKLKNLEEFIPFGIGRRACPGEAIARMELFLFLSSMFQRFQFLPPTPSSVPQPKYNFSSVASAKPYEVRVVVRK